MTALGGVSCSPSGGEGCRDSAFSAPDGLAPHSLRDLDKSIKTCFFTIKHSSHQFGQKVIRQEGYFHFSRTFGQAIAAMTGDFTISLAEVWKKLKAS